MQDLSRQIKSFITYYIGIYIAILVTSYTMAALVQRKTTYSEHLNLFSNVCCRLSPNHLTGKSTAV